ncbi:Transcription factor Sp1 [Armadillidium vulgare]|nr:Transcription factor Sp1 [Armadillidium vulgare]
MFNTVFSSNQWNPGFASRPDIVGSTSSVGYNSSINHHTMSYSASFYNLPQYSVNGINPYFDQHRNNCQSAPHLWPSSDQLAVLGNSSNHYTLPANEHIDNNYPYFQQYMNLNHHCNAETTSLSQKSQDIDNTLETKPIVICEPTSSSDVKVNIQKPIEEHKISRTSRKCTCKHCKTKSEDATKKKSYSCSFHPCEKTYGKSSHLKAHHRSHAGERPFLCKTCPKAFTRSDELQRHNRTHTGEKNYPCDKCTKRFARSDHLSKHKKTHEKEN